ncbi:hypothetical protein [Paenibacillus sp. GCM10023250]|uniref:hypothetical protein n=1 Tax=Paenibacillus sp. GCM10023250 TaxID=3252648 RepID=UPI00360F19EF
MSKPWITRTKLENLPSITCYNTGAPQQAKNGRVTVSAQIVQAVAVCLKFTIPVFLFANVIEHVALQDRNMQPLSVNSSVIRDITCQLGTPPSIEWSDPLLRKKGTVETSCPKRAE